MNYTKQPQIQSQVSSQVSSQGLHRFLFSLSIALGVMAWDLAPVALADSVEMRLAQTPPNQSDVTGPDVGNPQGPNVPGGLEDIPVNVEGLNLLRELIGNETDLDTIAQLISQTLNEAYDDCRASGQLTSQSNTSQSNSVRRFARGANTTQCSAQAPSQACQRLNQLIQETRTFISNQRQLRDQIRANSRVRFW